MVGKGKNAVDQVKAYNIAINEYLKEKSEKHLAEVEKVLTVLTQITNNDMWDLKSPDVTSLVVNSVQLLSLLDYKNSITWSLVSMFQKIADSSLSNSKLMRDGFQLFPALARLLHSIPSTTHNRTLKLLQLMLLLAQDVEVLSIGSFMTVFVKDLLNFINGDDEKCQVSAGLILSSLMRNNYPVVKLVLAQHSEELTTLNREEGAISLIVETLLFRLEQADLDACAPSASALTKILNQICEALKLAFRDVDKLQFKFFTDFLKDISRCPKFSTVLCKLDPLQLLADLVAIPQFDGCYPELWEQYFAFLHTLVSAISGHKLVIFDNIVKVALARLEVKPYNMVSSALRLLASVLQDVVEEDLAPADEQNLKLKVDLILPCVESVYRSAIQGTCGEVVSNDLCACLQLYTVLAGLQLDTCQTNCMKMKPADMLHALRAVFAKLDSGSEYQSALAIQFITLSKLMVDKEVAGWDKVHDEVVTNSSLMQAVADLIRCADPPSHMNNFVVKALTLLNSHPEYLKGKEGALPVTIAKVESPRRIGINLEELNKLEDTMEDLRLASANLNVQEEERVLPKVIDVQHYLGHRQEGQIRCLRGELQAAEEGLKHKNWHIEELNQQLEAHRGLLRVVSSRYDTARDQLQDIKQQHNSRSQLAEKEMAELTDQLRVAEKKLAHDKEHSEQLEVENEKLHTELEKTKSLLVAAEKECEEKDRAIRESRQAIVKRDEKLKRSLKMFDDEQHKREEQDKKIEKMSKTNTSLETLTRSQEEALNKKDKQIEDLKRESQELQHIRGMLFNLSKSGNAGNSTAGAD